VKISTVNNHAFLQTRLESSRGMALRGSGDIERVKVSLAHRAAPPLVQTVRQHETEGNSLFF